MRKLEGKEDRQEKVGKDRVLRGIYSLVTVGEFFATFFMYQISFLAMISTTGNFEDISVDSIKEENKNKNKLKQFSTIQWSVMQCDVK